MSFVDEDLTTRILHRWLNGTNMTELKAQNSLRTLQRFVIKVFIVNYDLRNTIILKVTLISYFSKSISITILESDLISISSFILI